MIRRSSGGKLSRVDNCEAGIGGKVLLASLFDRRSGVSEAIARRWCDKYGMSCNLRYVKPVYSIEELSQRRVATTRRRGASFSSLASRQVLAVEIH